MSVPRAMEAIGKIQMELTRYCLERNEGKPSREAQAHLAAMNLLVAQVVRSVSNLGHQDNYNKARMYLGTAERCAGGINSS